MRKSKTTNLVNDLYLALEEYRKNRGNYPRHIIIRNKERYDFFKQFCVDGNPLPGLVVFNGIPVLYQPCQTSEDQQ